MNEVKEPGSETSGPEPEELDILWGGEEIGRAINRTARQAFHLLEEGLIPARKVGGQWCASRRRLLRTLAGEVA